MTFLKPYYNEAWYREYESQKFYLFTKPPKDFLNCEESVKELFNLIPNGSTFKDPDLGNKLDELYSHDPLYKLIKQNMGRPTEKHLAQIVKMREDLMRDKIIKSDLSTSSLNSTPTAPITSSEIEKNNMSNNVVDHNSVAPDKKSLWKKLFGK